MTDLPGVSIRVYVAVCLALFFAGWSPTFGMAGTAFDRMELAAQEQRFDDVNREVDAAIKECTESIKVNSKDAKAFCNRGFCLHNKDECERALADFNEAIRLSPGYALAYGRRGGVLVHLHRYEEAIIDLSKAIAMGSPHQWQERANRAVAYMQLANACERQDEREQKCVLALRDLDEAIRLSPAEPRIYSIRGAFYERLGATDRALADYTDAIRLAPTSPEYLLQRGTGYWRASRTRDAIDDYQEALRLDPNSSAAIIGRGLCYLITGEFEKALDDFARARKLDPKDWKPCVNRAIVFAKMGKSREAIESCTEAIQVCPDEGELYVYRAALRYYDAHDLDGAIRDCESANRLGPDLIRAKANSLRGIIHWQSHAPVEAITCLSTAIRLAPRDSLLYLQRALVEIEMEKSQDAITDCTRAAEMTPQLLQSYTYRADAYCRLGQFDKALEDLGRAIKEAPRSADLYEMRSEIYVRCGKTKEARDDAAKAEQLRKTDGQKVIIPSDPLFGPAEAILRFADLPLRPPVTGRKTEHH